MPKTLHQTLNPDMPVEWLESVLTEIENIVNNETWSPIDDNIKVNNVVSPRFVFCKKVENDVVKKFKCQLVARGFIQLEGIDFNLTSSPTLGINNIRLLIGWTAANNLLVHQLGYTAAFLNAH